MSLQELQNLQFNLKFVCKQYTKSSKHCEKDEKAEIRKCKQAMEKGNIEGAKIYAQNAIRKKNEALNFLRLSARMDAVASRLDTAIKMKMVTKTMGAMTKSMDSVLKTMQPEAISRLMDTFEKQFETMDVTAEYMDSAIGQSVATSTPEDEVSQLMNQVAEEHGLDVKAQIGGGVTSSLPQAQATKAQDAECDELEKRFAALSGAGGGGGKK